MILQLGEIRLMIDVLPTILEKELPIKTAYWLARALTELQREFAPFETARQALVAKFASKDEAGELIVEGDIYVIEDMEAFQAEFAELASQEVEIKYNPLTLDQLGDIQVKGSDIYKLGRLINDDDDDIEVELVPPVLELVPDKE